MGLSAEAKVVGVRETLAALGELDPALRRQTLASMRKAAGPLQAAVSGAIPSSPPLSGMKYGRTAWDSSAKKAQTKTGGRKRRGGDSWPLVSVRATSPAASMADMAGRGSSGHTPQGVNLIGALTASGGRASRYVWPAAESVLPRVTAAVVDACRDAARQVQVRLDVRG